MRKYTFFALLLALLAIAVAPIIAQDAEEAGPVTNIRVAHFSPDAPAVDVYVNGEVAIAGLAFPDVTGWVQLAAGAYSIAVAPAGTSLDDAVIGPAEFVLTADAWNTVAAVGQVADGSLRAGVVAEDYSELPQGTARVTFFNAIGDAGIEPLDVLVNEEVVADELGLPGVIGDGAFTVDYPEGEYEIAFVPEEGSRAFFTINSQDIVGGSNYFIAAVGTIATDDGLAVQPVVVRTETRNIVTVAVQTPQLSTLVEAVVTADLAGALSGEGPFTVFAPVNNAFTDLLIEQQISTNDLLGNLELLTSTLQYHVVAGALSPADLEGSIFVDTLSGGRIWLDRDENGDLLLNGSTRILSRVNASNGVVYVIDSVLLPTPGTIAQLALVTPELSTLVTALDTAGLVGTFQGEGPFTVFAPVNNAFTDLLIEQQISTTDLLGNLDLLNSVLQYHVLPGVVGSADLAAGQGLQMLSGAYLWIEAAEDGSLVLANGARVITADIPARNGVIHLIDTVMLPTPGRIGQELSIADDFSTLFAAVETAGLTEALNGDGPFTVFAPLNNAFTDLLIDLQIPSTALFGDVDLLNTVLALHVVEGVFTAEDLAGVSSLTSLGGEELPVAVVDGVVTVAGVPVVTADIPARNGVIHAMGGVILPEAMRAAPEAEGSGEEAAAAGTIAEIAASAGTFNTLLAAVDAAGLTDALSTAGPFTVFAPTDEAFAALPQRTLNTILGLPDVLTNILTYHVVPGALSGEEVAAATALTTVQGSDIAVSVVDGTVVLNGTVNVIQADIVASNGVIHVIDGVLAPPR